MNRWKLAKIHKWAIKKCFDTNKDINLTLSQIRSTLIGNVLPGPATILFNRPILGLLPKIKRIPILLNYDDEHYDGINLALSQIRSTLIGNVLPGPATILFNRQILGLLPKINRIPILLNYDDEHYDVLKQCQQQVGKQDYWQKFYHYTFMVDCSSTQRRWQSLDHVAVVDHGTRECNKSHKTDVTRQVALSPEQPNMSNRCQHQKSSTSTERYKRKSTSKWQIL